MYIHHQTSANSVQFYFVDVFADVPLAGNPLALVVDAEKLSDEQMRAIAREFNQSETTFLLPPEHADATCRLRSFTPAGHEVLGAGHNALGAWLWLDAANLLPADLRDVSLAQEIGDSVLPVEVIRRPGQATAVSMDQSPPEYGKIVSDLAELAASLGLAEEDLMMETPAQVVSTGAGHLLVRVRSRTAVDAAAPDGPRLAAALRHVEGEGCYVYCTDPVGATEGAVAYTRFFNPTVGIAEDPATGTAAGPLVALLTTQGLAPENTTVVVEQGFALGRPSRIQVTVSGQRVRVSGAGLVVGDGTLYL